MLIQQTHCGTATKQLARLFGYKLACVFGGSARFEQPKGAWSLPGSLTNDVTHFFVTTKENLKSHFEDTPCLPVWQPSVVFRWRRQCVLRNPARHGNWRRSACLELLVGSTSSSSRLLVESTIARPDKVAWFAWRPQWLANFTNEYKRPPLRAGALVRLRNQFELVAKKRIHLLEAAVGLAATRIAASL